MASTESDPVEAMPSHDSSRPVAVEFHSILFDGDAGDVEAAPEPVFFGDLHLDQVLASLLAGREEYELAPLFYTPLYGVAAVRYRHQAMGDLEQDRVLAAVRGFADAMRTMRRQLEAADRLRQVHQRQRWFLQAVDVYCDAVEAFAAQLSECVVASPAFAGLRDHLSRYVRSDAFASLRDQTRELVDELAEIRYAIHIKGSHVKVDRYHDEPDMSEEIDHTFSRFKQGAVEDYRVRFTSPVEMNHIEAQILELVARLHPATFAKLEDYCSRHRAFLDPAIGRFDREVQFYLAYLELIEPMLAAGLTFSYPRVSTRSRAVHATDAFDIALAGKLVRDRQTVVANDFELSEPERILVVSGPNNGGKTTFARMFGQLHYLASLGLPVPGMDTRLFLADRIFTHFEREEDLETLRGKFEDELFRIHAILETATSDSLLVMNESFGSTTLRDAVVVGTEVMRQIIALDAACVFVTFVDELAALSETTVSMMSTVVAEDPAVRTFKVVRKPADGLAYAAAIADKYGLTYERLRRRVAG